jgi:Kelch motif/Galactose oxidase, central domain
MKRTRNSARYPFVFILSLLVVTLGWEPFAGAQVNPSWIPTGSLNTPRWGHTATLLPNGKVLVVGGGSAELYDPATGTWTGTASLNTVRDSQTATLLQNGKVLVAGNSSAELYDPATETWSITGSLNIARSSYTATLLQNGKVLAAGGWGTDDSLASAELYDPSTGTWSVTGSLIDDNQSHGFSLMGTGPGRYGHTATLLQNGKVLVAGGSNDGDLASTLASAELYDPSTGTWSFTGNLNASRISHTATLLPDGRVLVTGGYSPNFVPVGANTFAAAPTSLNGVELYDPATGTWSIAASLNTARNSHTATLLPNGKVLAAAGGYWTPSGNPPCGLTASCSFNVLNNAELYDPASGTWSMTASLNTPRSNYTATPLPGGKVLVAGGQTRNNALSSAELYESPVALRAAVLPSSRSVQMGGPATAFATIINAGQELATGCTISPITSIPATLTFQTTDPATNHVTGVPNTLVDIPPGAAQSFVFALTPTGPMAPTDVRLSFDCGNTDPAPVIAGLNTLLLSASATPTPDILALVATLSGDGIVNISGTHGVGAFAVATVNVGADDAFTVWADTGGASLPVSLFVCQTDPQTGACFLQPDSSVTATILSNETPTFGVFVAAAGDVSFFPETNRIFVRFKDSNNVTRGLTSVAVRTQ